MKYLVMKSGLQKQALAIQYEIWKREVQEWKNNRSNECMGKGKPKI